MPRTERADERLREEETSADERLREEETSADERLREEERTQTQMSTQADLNLETHKVVHDERVKEQNRLQRLLIRPEMGSFVGAIGIFILFLIVAPPLDRKSTRLNSSHVEI